MQALHRIDGRADSGNAPQYLSYGDAPLEGLDGLNVLRPDGSIAVYLPSDNTHRPYVIEYDREGRGSSYPA